MQIDEKRYDELTKFLYLMCNEETLDEIITLSKTLWAEHDNTYGYVDEKMARLDNIDTSDSYSIWAIYNMFDPRGQTALRELMWQAGDDTANIATALLEIDLVMMAGLQGGKFFNQGGK